MKIKIFLFTFNRPDILELQIKCLLKYVKNQFEIYVIHDSRDDLDDQKFLAICENYGVKYYKHKSIPGKNSSVYHAESLEWAYHTLVKSECVNDIVVFLDHDMFPIQDLDFVELMNDCDIIGLLQIRKSINFLDTRSI